MSMKLNEVQNEVVKEENVRALVDVLMHDNRISVAKIKNLEIKMEELKQTCMVGNRNSGGREFAIISEFWIVIGNTLSKFSSCLLLGPAINACFFQSFHH
jgi:dynactin complex subunit